MPKKYKRKSKPGKALILKPGIFIVSIFALGLLMIWKSNKVKDYYSKTKDLEKYKGELISEISEYRAELMDLKSITQVGEVIKKYGLTQNVSERLKIEIPATEDNAPDRKLFVNMDIFAEWLEEAVFRSGKINAQDRDKKLSKTE
jgi:cell division protein FtsL